MKNLILIMLFISFVSISFAEITDESFKNSNRYELLKDKSIGETDSINIEVKFLPPVGKKVNHATFVRTWEKVATRWSEIETIEVGTLPFEFSDNILLHNIILKSKNSLAALEIDFIHCDYQGGRCASKKFLTKINRNKSIKDNKLNFELKI